MQEEIPESDVSLVEAVHGRYQEIREQVGGTIVGLDDVIEQIFITLLCRSHCILEGVPGLAKTRLVSTMAAVLESSFRRIQFTPDLMPGDITGTDILEEDSATRKRSFRFVEGPLFGNIVLADEINRTPPKTQSALLEAMEERQVTVGGHTYSLPSPFFVIATQNPVEQEGTYPLPEAQLDRFMLKIKLGYPSPEEENEIARRATSAYTSTPTPVLGGEEIQAFQDLVRRVPVADHVIAFATALVGETRFSHDGGHIAWGAGPRATIFLVLAAKARAILRGRHHATEADILALSLPVLRHRIVPTFAAEAAGMTTDDIIESLAPGAQGSGVKKGSIPRRKERRS